jgi:hypothetical protein
MDRGSREAFRLLIASQVSAQHSDACSATAIRDSSALAEMNNVPND